MSLGKPLVFEAITYPDKKTVELYHELVNRHDHLQEALALYKKLEMMQSRDHIARSNYLRIRESLMWFLTVEFYSRFLSDHKTRNGSKRGIKKLLEKIGDEQTNKKYKQFLVNETATLFYLKTQRNKYLAHADDVNWDNFPKVFDDEYERALAYIASVLNSIGKIIGTQRICSPSATVTDIFCEV